VSNLSLGSVRCRHRRCTGSPDPRQHSFESRHQPGIRSVMRGGQRRSDHAAPGFPLPFGHRRSLLGSSCARWGIGPSSRSAYQHRATARRRTSSGLSRSACLRLDRVGRPLNPGNGGIHATGKMPPVASCRFTTASSCYPDTATVLRGSLW